MIYIQQVSPSNRRGTGVGTSPPGKLYVKTGPPPGLYFGSYHFLVFSMLLFFAFFGVFL